MECRLSLAGLLVGFSLAFLLGVCTLRYVVNPCFLGVVLLVERENNANLIPLFDTCRQLRDRVVEDVISVGVMTDDIKGVRMIGVDVAVPYRGSPKDFIGPLAAGVEGRRGRNPSF